MQGSRVLRCTRLRSMEGEADAERRVIMGKYREAVILSVFGTYCE